MIQTGGKNLPIYFGMVTLLDLEEEGIDIADLGDPTAPGKIGKILKLLYFGFREGHRMEGKDFAADIRDIARLLDSDDTLLNRCIEVFQKAMPDTEGNAKPQAATKLKSR
jgi:hypothetical protein